MRRFVVTAAIAVVLGAVAISAPAQMPTPQPAPELKKLDYFIGKWSLQGDLKPRPTGPLGKMTMTEYDAGMEGNFLVVAHSKFSSASMGGGSAISFMG